MGGSLSVSGRYTYHFIEEALASYLLTNDLLSFSFSKATICASLSLSFLSLDRIV